MEYVDYYKALGVDRNASEDEISKAYKRMARKYHPDLNKDAGAEEHFKEINEANEVLKDPDKRSRYDALGANWKHGSPFDPASGGFPGGFPGGFGGRGPGGVRFDFGGGGPGGPRGGMGGFSSFFETLFGGGEGPSAGPGGFGGGGFGPGRQRGGARYPAPPQRGQDVKSHLRVSLEDVYHGKKPKVTFTLSDGQTKRYDITIPKTIRSGEEIRLSGQGSPGPAGAPAGDLYLEIEIADHPVFAIEDDNLVVRVDVPAWDAALGAKIPVPTLDGEVKLTLPAGVSSGQRLRLKNKGLHQKGDARGDLYAEIKITVPKPLTETQHELFEKLRDA
ncbi:MAG: DnaJ domain-containing protein [Deltaproteobacteria bacterium]|nr:DnaJ domain-containing protein [Deltaproteobacteria bacterium]